MLVCGIDIGIKNLAVCVTESATNSIVYLKRIDLFDGNRPEPKQIIYCAEQYFRANDIFKSVRLCIIENQMQQTMHKVAYALEALFAQFCRAHSVHPVKIKNHFGTRKLKGYKQNKNAAVEWIRANLVGANLALFNEVDGKNDDVSRIMRGVTALSNILFINKKTTQVADSIMLAQYGIEHYNVLIRPPEFKELKKTKKRKRK